MTTHGPMAVLPGPQGLRRTVCLDRLACRSTGLSVCLCLPVALRALQVKRAFVPVSVYLQAGAFATLGPLIPPAAWFLGPPTGVLPCVCLICLCLLHAYLVPGGRGGDVGGWRSGRGEDVTGFGDRRSADLGNGTGCVWECWDTWSSFCFLPLCYWLSGTDTGTWLPLT